MATWLAVDQLDFRGAWAVANGWLRRAHGCLIRSIRVPSTVGSPSRRDTSPTRGRPAKRPSWPAGPRRVGRRSAFPISRCSASPCRARRWSAVPRREGMRWLEGHATALEGEAPSRSRRVDLLLPRQCLHGRARLRARVGVVRPDRRVRRALREPLHARLLPRRVRGGAAAGAAAGRTPRPCSRRRSRTSSRSRPAWVAGRWWPWPSSAAAGEASRKPRPARPGRALLQGAAVPRAPGARPGRLAQAVDLLGALLRQVPARPATSTARPRSSCSPSREWREASSTRPAGARRHCARVGRGVGTAPLSACVDLTTGVLAVQPRRRTRTARALLEDAIDPSSAAGALRGAPGADSSSPACCSSSAGGRTRNAKRALHSTRLTGLGAAARRRAGPAHSSPPRPAAAAASPGDLTPREREMLAPARRRPHEPADRRAPRGERAHRPSARRPTCSASSSSPSRTAAAARRALRPARPPGA